MTQTATLVRFSGNTPYAANEQVSVGSVRVLGTRVWMVYRRDEPEWERRRRHGLGAVTELDVLDALMDLPAGMPVPLRSLHARERQLLGRVPQGAVRHGAGMVIRQIVPAVTPLLAIVAAREWSVGAAAASRFAVYCPRLVVLSQLPEGVEATLLQASFYGIGVAAGGSKPSQIVVEPEPLTDWQPTPAWWAFSENVYGQVRRQHL